MSREQERPASHYEVLGVAKGSGRDVIRKRYLELALKYHPDKGVSESDGSAEFLAVRRAWEVLGNEASRAEYDRVLSGAGGAAPWKEVDLDDMELEERPSGDVYCYDCRCGARFEAPAESLTKGYDLFDCPSCSLSLRVLFDVDDDPPDEP